MADSDDGSASRARSSHYNQQRSSLRSDRSGPTTSRPHSRPHSGPQARPPSSQVLNDHNDEFTLPDGSEVPYLPPSAPPSAPVSPSLAPAPAPPIPRIPQRRQSLEKRGKVGSRNGISSRHGSSRGAQRTGSRGRNIDQLLSPDAWEKSNEVEAPLPIQNPYERPRYSPSTLEEERTESRESKKLRSKRSSKRYSGHAGTAGRSTPGSNLDITALPTLSDNGYGHRETAYSKIATELYAISYLILFSILGTLARLGLQWLTFYPGAPVTFSELWANVGGSLVMGFFSEDRRLFQHEWGNLRAPTPPRTPLGDQEKAPQELDPAAKAAHTKAKKTIPLYIGLTTGFCGSFTSFSSFVRDMFLAFVNDLPAPVNHPYPPGTTVSTATTLQRNSGYSFMAGLAVVLLTLSLCYTALKLGAHLAIALDPYTPSLPFRLTRRFLDPLIVALAWLTWLGAIIMAIWPPDRPNGPSSKGAWPNETWRGQAIFACVFAPAGCLLRFYLSLALNPLIPSFPLGTFAVNIFGTAVLGMAFDLQHIDIGESGVGGGRVACQALQGLMDGFCGALTTVSTWVLEIDGLKRRHAYAYGAGSVAVGLLTLLVIMGSVRWSVGWSVTACAT